MKPLSKIDLYSYSPIQYNGLLIHKPLLREMGQLGHSHFQMLNSLLTMSEDDLLVLQAEQEKKGEIPVPTTDPYKYMLFAAQNINYFLELKMAFFTYLKRDVQIRNGNLIVIASSKEESDFTLDSTSFYELQTIIRQINNLEIADEPDIINEDSEMVAKFVEARKKLRLAKAKERQKARNKGEGLDLSTVQTAVSAMFGYTPTEVEALTIYQLFALFKMGQQKENYTLSHHALCAGAKCKLNYWVY